MIQIDKNTSEKLDKFAGIHARIERLSAAENNAAVDALCTPEYHALKDDLIEEFLRISHTDPILKAMVRFLRTNPSVPRGPHHGETRWQTT